MPPKTQTAWMRHVKETMRKNPTVPFSQVLKVAAGSYKKTGNK